MSELLPCAHCGEPKQLEVVKIDFKNDWRDLIKCRNCRSQAMRKYWNKRDTSAIEAAVLRRVADELSKGHVCSCEADYFLREKADRIEEGSS